VKIKTYESDHYCEDPWLKKFFTLEVLINVLKTKQKLRLTSENNIFAKFFTKFSQKIVAKTLAKIWRKCKDIFAKNEMEF